MDTLATFYDKMHVIECSGATLLLGLSLQISYFRDTLSCPLSQQVVHLPIVTALS